MRKVNEKTVIDNRIRGPHRLDKTRKVSAASKTENSLFFELYIQFDLCYVNFFSRSLREKFMAQENYLSLITKCSAYNIAAGSLGHDLVR